MGRFSPLAAVREAGVRPNGRGRRSWAERQIQDNGAYTGRVGYTHRPYGQGQALSDPTAIES